MAIAVSLFILFLQFALVVFMFYLCIAFLTGAPFVPSTRPVSEVMVRLAGIKPGMTIYDLGSGDGRLLFLAQKLGAGAIGIEINPLLVLYTNIRALLSGKKKDIGARWGSFWKANLKDADVVFIYLLPWRMEKLERKLTSELKKGTIVVSNSFIFPNLKIIRQDKTNHVYVYRI